MRSIKFKLLIVLLLAAGVVIVAQASLQNITYLPVVIDQDARGRIRFHYVIVDLTADYVSGEPRAGDDATAARWVSSDDMVSLNVSSKTRQLLKTQYNFGD